MMKQTMRAVLAAVCLTVLAGCVSYYVDQKADIFFPNGTVQWGPLWSYAPGSTKIKQNYLVYIVRTANEELEQQGMTVSKNLSAEKNGLYQLFEQRLRKLPPGTRLVVCTGKPGDAVIAVAFLTGDGSFDHYTVEDHTGVENRSGEQR